MTSNFCEFINNIQVYNGVSFIGAPKIVALSHRKLASIRSYRVIWGG